MHFKVFTIIQIEYNLQIELNISRYLQIELNSVQRDGKDMEDLNCGQFIDKNLKTGIILSF